MLQGVLSNALLSPKLSAMGSRRSEPVESWELDVKRDAGDAGYEAWQDAMSVFCDFLPLGGLPGFSGKTQGYLMAPFVFFTLSVDRSYARRSGRHLRQDVEGFLILNLFRGGRSVGVLGDTPITRAAGTVDLMDFTQQFLTLNEDRTQIACVAIPHGALGFVRGSHPSYLALAAGTLKHRMLTATLQEIFQRLPRTTRDETPTITAGFAGLLRGLFMDSMVEGDRDSVQAAVRATVLAYIDVHLRDRSLDAARLCRVFGMSRATLYRLFETTGGVAKTIRKRRLYRCFLELAQRREGTPVREVAERYGFTNASHFTRCFKEEFPLAPSDIRPRLTRSSEREVQELAALCEGGRPYTSWMDQILISASGSRRRVKETV